MKIGRYVVLDALSNGPLADVYRARDELGGRDVVVKLLAESAKEQVLAEVQRMIALADAYVVQIYDTGYEGDRLFYVMPIMEGGTLAERVRDEGLSLYEIRPILANLTTALTAAHDQQIVHCDIKPTNILFSADDEAYVADFGIARHLNETNEGVTTTSGTPAYMAPEQWRGERATPQIDVYQCGVLLFLLLTGQMPFQGRDRTAMQAAHCGLPVPSAHEVASHLSAEFDTFFEKALAKSPVDRFPSMKVLEAEFLKLTQPQPPDPPVPDHPKPEFNRLTIRVRGHEWVSAWAIGMIAGWLIAAWLINWLSPRFNLAVVRQLDQHLLIILIAAVVGAVPSGVVATLTIKLLEGRLLTNFPRQTVWISGATLTPFVQLGVMLGGAIALIVDYWQTLFVCVGVLPPLITAGAVGEWLARTVKKFGMAQRLTLALGWTVAGVVGWLIVSIVLSVMGN